MGDEEPSGGAPYRVVEEWERLGLDKRVDWENLRRVFERLDLKVPLNSLSCLRRSLPCLSVYMYLTHPDFSLALNLSMPVSLFVSFSLSL